MNLIGNIIWIIFGGFFIFLEYIIAGLLLCCTIVGIPWGLKIIQLSVLGLAPLGQQVVDTPETNGCLTLILNLIWILIGGIWIALTHLLLAFIFAITIIGIPFAIQHIKLSGFAFLPFGKTLR